MTRPAELAGASGAIALLVARLLGVTDPDVLISASTVIGLLPAAVTLVVAHGGIAGALRRLWRGK